MMLAISACCRHCARHACRSCAMCAAHGTCLSWWQKRNYPLLECKTIHRQLPDNTHVWTAFSKPCSVGSNKFSLLSVLYFAVCCLFCCCFWSWHWPSKENSYWNWPKLWEHWGIDARVQKINSVLLIMHCETQPLKHQTKQQTTHSLSWGHQ